MRSGYNNNDLFIVPAWNMVIVRLGLDEQENEITGAEYDGFLQRLSKAILDPVVEGTLVAWHPLQISFRGPSSDELTEDPNPFLDWRLQVQFKAPSGHRYDVPGYFDGDGYGQGAGDVWRVQFAPDEPGQWSYQVSLRAGPKVAIALDPDAGEAVGFDGACGFLAVKEIDPASPEFLRWGRLEYVGQHYLKFRQGPYWIRGGTDSPENLLAYAGFDNTPPSHRFADHQADWRPGDPDWGDRVGRGIIGALNYLATEQVNSIYFLTMNVGGDGGDVWPWVKVVQRKGGPENDNLHYDISKLRQWGVVLDHAQRRGLFLHIVLNEGEQANKRELDDGELGVERKLYYRELVARFAHHGALQWNLCEEYNLNWDFGPQRICDFADYLRAIDPYDHPITVHSAGDPLRTGIHVRGRAVQHDVDSAGAEPHRHADQCVSGRDRQSRSATACLHGRVHVGQGPGPRLGAGGRCHAMAPRKAVAYLPFGWQHRVYPGRSAGDRELQDTRACRAVARVLVRPQVPAGAAVLGNGSGTRAGVRRQFDHGHPAARPAHVSAGGAGAGPARCGLCTIFSHGYRVRDAGPDRRVRQSRVAPVQPASRPV